MGTTVQDIKDQMIGSINQAIEAGFTAMESNQSKMNKAVFEALSMAQRDVVCQSLDAQGVPAKQIQKLTGKSQPTVNRHINGKNTI